MKKFNTHLSLKSVMFSFLLTAPLAHGMELCNSPFLSLPQDLVVTTAVFLDFADISALSRTSTTCNQTLNFNQLLLDPNVCKNLNSDDHLNALVHYAQNEQIMQSIMHNESKKNRNNRIKVLIYFGYINVNLCESINDTELFNLPNNMNAFSGIAHNITNINESSILHLAVCHGHKAIVRMLLEKGANINEQATIGLTPLHVACRDSQIAIAGLLIDKGADSTILTNADFTAMHLVCDLPPSIEIIQLLLEKGLNPNIKNREESTPLHCAAINRYMSNIMTAVMTLLIKNKADMDAQDNNGNTPLHCALYNNRQDMACLLIESGCNTNIQNKNGEAALHLALTNRHGKCIQLLVEKGCNVNIQNRFGETALHIAAGHGLINWVKLIVEHEAKTNTLNNMHKTALDIAKTQGLLTQCESYVTCVNYLENCTKAEEEKENNSCLIQ